MATIFPVTVLADVPDDARAMREEPFGPLALLSRVRNVDEAIEKANSVPYGLAAYAFTNSARNVDRLAEGVEVGNLSINHFVASSAETPFGGVKDSGFGREGCTEWAAMLYCGEERLTSHCVAATSTGSGRYRIREQALQFLDLRQVVVDGCAPDSSDAASGRS